MAKKRKQRTRKAQLKARAYEAAISTPSRGMVRGADQSPDAATDHAFERVREWGRYLEQNSPIAVSILDELCKNVVGQGIVTIPKPLNSDGSINKTLGRAIIAEWQVWSRRADVTSELSWSAAQRQIVRAWCRDGEEFLQHVSGRASPYPFAAAETPYRIELVESDFVPKELTNNDGWRQGVRRNEWKQPNAYGVLREHPADQISFIASRAVTLDDVIVKPAEIITHIKNVTRWPQTRGVSVFAPVVGLLYDIKDLEESERIKNRALASWVAAIQKSPDVAGVEDTNERGQRFVGTFPGTLIDGLTAGETIVGVGPDYPVAEMPSYIQDQHRRLAAGVGVRYSSISKHYEGSYSAMRQELMESVGHYAIREDDFVAKVCREVYERWLMIALLDGQIEVAGPFDFERLANAEYRGPVMPWIDPLKEVQADALAVEKGFASIDQIRIKRGAPAEMIGQPAPSMTQPRAPQSTDNRLSLVEEGEAA